MALGTLPPWLDVTPAQFGQAAAEGQRVNLERARLQQSAHQAAAQLGLEAQRLAASERQAAMSAQIHREQVQANFQRAQSQQAMAKAYHDAQLGLQKQRLDLAGQKLQAGVQTAADQLNQKQQAAAYKQAHPQVSNAELMSLFPGVPPNFIAAMDKPATAPTETVTQHFPLVQGQPADVKPAHTRGWYNPARWFGDKNVPAVTNSPAIEGHPAYSVTQKIPANVSPAEAFRAMGPGTNAVAGTNAPAPNIIRDKNGKFILAPSPDEDQTVEP